MRRKMGGRALLAVAYLNGLALVKKLAFWVLVALGLSPFGVEERGYLSIMTLVTSCTVDDDLLEESWILLTFV